MSKPESIKVDPWTDFPRQSDSIITDDFCHDKLATLKVNAKGSRSTANIKASIAQGKSGFEVNDELKFWFQVSEGKNIFAKLKSKNYVKLHYDHGVTRIWNKDWNLYASLNATKNLDNVSVRLGATNLNKVCHSDNRLKFDSKDPKNMTWYNRTIVNKNKFTFGLLGAYGFANNVLVKNNILLGYEINESSSAFLRLENDGYRSTGFDWGYWPGYFDHIKVSFVSRQKDIKCGLQV